MAGTLAWAVSARTVAQLPEDIVVPGVTSEDLTAVPDGPRLHAISVVVVDPGHGGDDPGGRDVSGGLLEKDLSLAVARRAEAVVARETGARVLVTRPGDVRVAPVDRASMTNEAHGDLLISIHANSAPSPKTRGFTVYYHDPSGDTSPSVVEGAEPWAQGQKAVEGESARFAEVLRESLAAKVALPDRGVRRLPMAVLEGAACPAVLVEMGFLSNPEEALALSTGAVQDAVAEAIAESVLRMDAILAGSHD